jgi:AcrR family transcriptional regulator
VAAAIETLKREGYAGTSARAVAATGGFAQGVVFYHFGAMTDLLLSALQETSRQRLEHYEAAVGGVESLPELVAVAGTVFRDDLEAGHVRVLSELIAAASTLPELGPEIGRCVAPWIDFTEAAITRVLAASPLAEAVPARDAAFAIVALYLGMELLTQLNGDAAPAESLFASAERLARALGPFLTAPATPAHGGSHD